LSADRLEYQDAVVANPVRGARAALAFLVALRGERY